MFLEVGKTYVDTIGGVVSFFLVHKQNQSALIGRQLSTALKLPQLNY